MGSISNPSSSGQSVAEKGQNNGYLGIGSEGQVTIPGTLTVVGKTGINNLTPPTKSADCGTSNTSLSVTLLTEVAPAINADRTKLNEIRTCLRNHGLMA